jgi:hypothetical protein
MAQDIITVAERQLDKKLEADKQLAGALQAGYTQPNIKQQLQLKLVQHEQDQKKLNKLIELYDSNPAVAEFAELLGIRLG